MLAKLLASTGIERLTGAFEYSSGFLIHDGRGAEVILVDGGSDGFAGANFAKKSHVDVLCADGRSSCL